VEQNANRAKEPVSAALAGPYGHPFHPMLVTVPIGAWICSVIFDVASHLATPRPPSPPERSGSSASGCSARSQPPRWGSSTS
jgi:hypothetical protein